MRLDSRSEESNVESASSLYVSRLHPGRYVFSFCEYPSRSWAARHKVFDHSESVHKAILGGSTHQNYDGESASLRCARVLALCDPTTRGGRYGRREEKHTWKRNTL